MRRARARPGCAWNTRSHQGPGCGVLRVVEQIGRCPRSTICPWYSTTTSSQVVHHGQIVADEQEAHAKFLLQVFAAG